MKVLVEFEVRDYDDDAIENIPIEDVEYSFKRMLNGWHNPLSGYMVVKKVVEVKEK